MLHIKKVFTTIAFLSLFSIFHIEAQATYQELPLDDFVKHSDYLDIKLSPDGKHIASRIRENDTVYMITWRVSDGQFIGGVKPGKKNEVASVHWVTNTRLIYTFAEKYASLDAPIPTGELFAIDVDSKSNIMLAGFRASDAKPGSRLGIKDNSNASHELLNVLPDDKNNVLIIEYPWSTVGRWMRDRRETQPIVSKLNIYTGKKTRKEVIPYRGARVWAGDDGEVKFATWSDDSTSQNAVYRASKKQAWQNISTTLDVDIGALTPVAINKSGSKIYLTGSVGSAQISKLFELELTTKKISAVFDNLAELDYWKTDINGDPTIGVSYPAHHQYHYSLMNPESHHVQHHKKLQKAFANQEVQIESHSDDGKTFILRVSSDINPGEYYIYNTETKKADFLWANFSWIDPRTLSPTKPIMIKARDDQELHGYLTIPNTETHKKALVVLPHGGPHGIRDYPHYNAEVQLLVNRGYTVLQINFRGSSGYGHAFEKQGYKNWGKVMIDDIIDSTRWAIKEGYADKEKVCIYGASYGGYSALMAAAKAPELYKCSIGYVGVYDLEAMKVKGDIPTGFRGRSYLEKILGSDVSELKQQSPLSHAHKIKAKVMLIHGDEDVRAPSYHSKVMRTALKKANNPAEWLYLRDAGHGAFSIKNRTKVYKGLLEFLEQNIGS